MADNSNPTNDPKTASQLLELAKEELRIFKLLNQEAKTYSQKLHSVYEQRQKELEVAQASLDAAKEKIKQDFKEKTLTDQQIKSREELLKKLKNEVDLRTKELEISQELKENYESIAGDVQQTTVALTGISTDWRNTLMGKIAIHGKQGIDDIATSMREILTFPNIKGSFFKGLDEGIAGLGIRTYGLILSQDEAMSSFQRLSGQVGTYNEMIQDVYQSNAIYGVSAQDVTKANMDLLSGFSAFRSLAPEVQHDMLNLATLAERNGVSSETFAAGLQTANKQLAIMPNQAAKVQRQLLTAAKTLQVAPEQMISGFSRAGGSMAKFGEQGVKAFVDLQKSANETGLSVDQLLDITNKFDTFDGAAESVGHLNAILGGTYLNSIQLIKTTDPTERLHLMKNALDQAGKSFDTMGYYEKITIQNALGLKDVGELAQLMSGDFKGLTKEQDMNAESLVKMKQDAAKVTSVQDQMRAIVDNLTVSLTGLIKVVRPLTEFLVAHGTATSVIVGLIVAMRLGYMGLIGVMTLYRFFQKAQVPLDETTIASSQGVAASLAEVGTAAAGAAVGVAGFSLPIIGIGAVMVGWGLAIALIVNQLTGLLDVVLESDASFAKMSLSVIGLGLAFTGFALLGPVMAIGLATFVTQLGVLAIAMRAAAKTAEPMIGFMDSLTNLATSTGLSNVATEVLAIAEAVESIPQEKSIAFRGVIDSIKGLETAKAGIVNTGASATARTTAQAVLAGTSTTNQSQYAEVVSRQPLEIKLMLDERQLGSHIIDVVGKNLEIRTP